MTPNSKYSYARIDRSIIPPTSRKVSARKHNGSRGNAGRVGAHHVQHLYRQPDPPAKEPVPTPDEIDKLDEVRAQRYAEQRIAAILDKVVAAEEWEALGYVSNSKAPRH